MITGHDDPMLTAEPQLRRIEQGNFAQRALRRGFYPAMGRTPVRDSVFFVSWKGKQCGDNPLGIAAELRRRGDDREQLWAVTDWSVPVPDGGAAVLRGTQEYYEALARSRYLVSNDDMQAPFRKRNGQIYLQTWHGTPLKRIGFDISNPQFISGTAYFDHLAAADPARRRGGRVLVRSGGPRPGGDDRRARGPVPGQAPRSEERRVGKE